jgi:hypothetical protein
MRKRSKEMENKKTRLRRREEKRGRNEGMNQKMEE